MKEIREKIAKTNDQRIVMALTLLNVMKSAEDSNIRIRLSIAASLIDMLDNCMIEEDTDLVRVLNEGIDAVCEDAKKYGVKDVRVALKQTIELSRQQSEEQMTRIKNGTDILKQINLN